MAGYGRSGNAGFDRAHRHFIEALLALMREKPYETVSISELAERACYDRRTFYRHFRSKDDVICSYCVVLFREMALAMNKRGPLTPQSGFLSYFEFWSKHRDFLLFLDKHDLLRLLGEKQDQLLYQNVGLLVHGDLPKRLDENSEFSQFAYYFTLGGLWAVLIYWVRTGMHQTPETLTDHVLRSFREMEAFIC